MCHDSPHGHQPERFLAERRAAVTNTMSGAVSGSYAQSIGRGTFVFTLTTGASLHSGHAYREMILAALPLRRRSANH